MPSRARRGHHYPNVPRGIQQVTYSCLRDCNNIAAIEEKTQKSAHEAQASFGNHRQYALQYASQEGLCLVVHFLALPSIIQRIKKWSFNYDIQLIETGDK
jgi:hypothetical protein